MKTNHTKDEQSEVRGIEGIENALHQYAAWLLNNPNAEPLQRRAMKNTIAVDLLTHLQEQHEREKRELVEGILSKKQYLVNQDAYKAEGVFKKDIRAVAQRHGLSTKE